LPRTGIATVRARVAGLNQTSENAWPAAVDAPDHQPGLVAVTIRLLTEPGTVTICSGLWAAWRPITRVPHPPYPLR
jgi:hypothetical protein